MQKTSLPLSENSWNILYPDTIMYDISKSLCIFLGDFFILICEKNETVAIIFLGIQYS